MIEIKFLGRGGQGVVVASEILARACFEEGLYPQSFSIFGGERRGATVAAFVRVDHEKIYQVTSKTARWRPSAPSRSRKSGREACEELPLRNLQPQESSGAFAPHSEGLIASGA